MPAPNSETAHEALVRVCNAINDSGTGGTHDDYAFIKAILQDVVVDAMFQTHDRLRKPMEPADHNATATVNHLLDLIDHQPVLNDPSMRELFQILADHDMQAVLMAHDDIARKSFEPVQYPLEPEPVMDNRHDVGNGGMMPHDDGPVRYVGMRRVPGEPLGITVGNEDGDTQLTVVRIASGSTTDKQGLLSVGDIILEVNGKPVHTPDQLGDVIQSSGPDLKFKVLPAGAAQQSGSASNQRFLKAHFAYNPQNDSRISSPSLGLSFEPEDILAVLKDTDRNWWECKNLRTNKSGKIPSPSYEEKRKQMSQPPPEKQKSSLLCGLGKKKKRPSTNSAPIKQDETPVVLYEEVIKVRPFRHRCLVLVGAQGIGRRSIKNKIIQIQPQDFGAPIPSTSRPMRDGETDGKNYHFRSRDEMDSDIKSGKYLEHGELNRNYYGTSFNALRSVIDSGKTCIVDPKSAALPKLRTIEWMPYVVFIKPTDAESLKRMNSDAINEGVETAKKSDDETRKIMDETHRISRQFIHYCDAVVRYDNFHRACDEVLDLLRSADSKEQWVPLSWEAKLDRVSVPL